MIAFRASQKTGWLAIDCSSLLQVMFAGTFRDIARLVESAPNATVALFITQPMPGVIAGHGTQGLSVAMSMTKRYLTSLFNIRS